MATGKGKFSADIGEDVIAAALDSVEKRTRSGESLAVDDASGTGSADPQGAEPEAEASPSPEPSLPPPPPTEERVAELEGQLREERERALRAAADLDNYRKRAKRDLQEGIRYANERLLKDFLPVLDNLERALEHGSTARDWASLEQGLRMTRKQFEDVLGLHGARPLTALGRPFDPNQHEAMGYTESSEAAPNTVLAEVLRGWMLNDRLVRPALVSVARPPGSAEAEPAPSTGEGAPDR